MTVFKPPHCVCRAHRKPAVLGPVALHSLWQSWKFSSCLCIILGGGGRDLLPTVSWPQAQPGGLLQMNPQRAAPWRGCTQLTREAAGISHGPERGSWTRPTFTLSNTACNSIPGLLKEMHPLRLLKCYSTFSSNMVFTVPGGKEKSALPPEPLAQLVFIAEMFTLRKPLSHISLPLVGYSHLYWSQSFSY